MQTGRRRRLTLLAAMGIVALSALLLGWVAAERRKRVEALAAELRGREERAAWAGRMQRRGYVSKAQLAVEQARVEGVRAQLKSMGASAGGP